MYSVPVSSKRFPSTPQTEQAPGTVPNSAGGFSFPVDDWTRLQRFLTIGSESGSYYASSEKLTKENSEAVIRCIKSDGLRAVKEIVEISDSGRAAKNEPAIFALALAASLGDDATRASAFSALVSVCRTGTSLMHFVNYCKTMRGFGRGLRNAIANWYLRSPKEVSYQVVKYASRDGWSNRDLLRLSHPKPTDENQKLLFHYITQGLDLSQLQSHSDRNDPLAVLWATELVKNEKDISKIVKLIADYRLPREVLPTELLNNIDIWEALLQDMPMTALIRNLAKMTQVGLLTKRSRAVKKISSQLENVEHLQRARIHPITLLSALKVYEQGHGERGSLAWSPVSAIVDSLDTAFYSSFKTITPSNKRIMLAVDVSGSMGCSVSGLPGLSCRDAAAVMSLVTMSTESNTSIYSFSTKFRPLVLSPNERLDSVIRKMNSMDFGGTDCSLPMNFALDNRLAFDAFVTYTDSVVWAGGRNHPSQALVQYRHKMQISAKLVVNAFVANKFSIADPNDNGMMDVSGLDSATPSVISDFIRA